MLKLKEQEVAIRTSVNYAQTFLPVILLGLFHRGYSQSGCAILPWALTKGASARTKIISKKMNCNDDSSQEILSCLRKKTPKDIASIITTFFVLINAIPVAPIGPVIEKVGPNPFITDHPYKLLKEGKIVNDVPWIASNVKDEGLFVLQCKCLDFLFQRF